MAESIKQQAISSAKWAAIEKFSVQLIQFGIGIILARLLTPSDYGTIGMLTVFMAISNVFIDSGFSSALIRKLERTEDDYSTVFITNFAISLFFVVILFFAAPWVAKFYNLPILCPILRVQSLNLIVYACMAVQTAKLKAEINFKALAKASLISSPLSGIIGIILAYIGWGVWALVAQNLLYAVFRLGCVIIQCRWLPKLRFSKKSFDDLFGFGKNMLGTSLLTAIYFNLDSLVIGKFFSPASLGNFSRGSSLAKLPVHNINGVLDTATYPILAKLQNETERLISAYKKYIKLTSMCIFFCCMLMAALGKPIVLFLLGEKWSDAIIFLQVYCFAVMFNHISTINLNLMKVKGRSDLVLKLEVVKRIISFSILMAAIPFGVIGICLSKVVYSLIAICINCYYNGKLFKMGLYSQVQDFKIYLLYSFLTGIPAYALTYLYLPAIITIILGFSISSILYLFLLRNDDIKEELMSMIKNKIKK